MMKRILKAFLIRIGGKRKGNNNIVRLQRAKLLGQ
jgi:hypothetical protein